VIRSNALAYALYANAIVLLGIFLVLLSERPGMVTPAMAEPVQGPIAGGGGIFVMPCQLHPSVWGCYLLDTDLQTLCTYEYRAGEKALVLTAARDFRYDLQLKNYDTFPAWYDVKKLVEEQAAMQNTDAGPDSSKTPQTSP
jgi:hypothetical protein